MDPRFLAGQDLENSVSGDYTVLVGENSVGDSRRSGLVKGLIYAVLLGLSIGLVVVLIAGDYDGEMQKSIVGSGFSPATKLRPAIRGVEKGVSKKSVGLSFTNDFPWTNDLLSWQRTAFHFQPEKNWMNDPNGPLYYKGWYHLFYQYNPDSAVWGNITWGHAISRDLIHWLYLPLAMVPDRWFDIDGVWTGSATVLPNGTIVMLYTGSTAESVQVQNLAIPADPYDPLLRNWVKYHKNPVILPPAGIGKKDFRDPTTAWITPDGTWRIAIGSKLNRTGITLIYKTTDFIKYELVDGIMHGVPGTGMWECVDFYPVSTSSRNGLDTSANGPGVKHVLKASMDDDRNDYYAIGSYNDKKDTWSPDIDTEDVGIGKRYDYGKFYASKTFYDQRNGRRILWGWIGESDSERADVMKGWASVLAVPREVLFDKKTGTNLLQWPVKEVESLRSSSYEFHNVSVGCGSVMPLNIGTSTQVDVTAEFQIGKEALEMISEFEGEEYNCETGGGAAGRGRLGPFGFLVLADQSRSEQTAVYFYVGKSSDGNLQSFFCQDETRSSKANDIVKKVYGSLVPVLNGENLTVRILVDHSIVESFAQRGRTCITSRVYPTEANNGGARMFLFNNATLSTITAVSVKIWQMKSAVIHPYTA